MDILKLSTLGKRHDLKKVSIIQFFATGSHQEITYCSLFKFAKKIKTFLMSNITTEKPICIGLLMEKNILIPSIVISLQELNYTFMFLSSSNFLENMKSVNIKWILTDCASLSSDDCLMKNSLCPILCVNLHLGINRHYLEGDNSSGRYKNIFCIMETSGSTGTNKLISIPFNCIEKNVVSLNNFFNIGNDDVIYWGTPLTFDPSLVELLLGLIYGARLVIVPKLISLNPVLLYQVLFEKAKITFLQMVPSLFLRWNHQQISKILLNETLRCLALGGESFPLEILKYQRHDQLSLYNLYGVTELSCWATIAKITSDLDQEEVPLGRVLDDTFIQIEDKDDNGVGEICLGSHTRYCLINNVLRNSNSPFIIQTGDLGQQKKDNIYYRGRKTRMIKHFGHKLVLDKIESIIMKETSLPSRLVHSAEHKKLLAFIVIEEYQDDATKLKLIDKLKVKLLNTLPEHGVPDFIDVVTHFPLSSHGKVSDRALIRLYENKSFSEESNASDIFIRLLGAYLKTELSDELFKGHSFYELGGNSIIAMQFLRSFERSMGDIEIPGELIALLLNNTIEKCIGYVCDNLKFRKRTHDSDNHGECSKMLKISTEPLSNFVKWKYDLKGCVDATPLIFTRHNQAHVACGSFAHRFSVLSATGQEYFNLTLPGEIEARPSISSCANFIFIGCSNGTMNSIDLELKKTVWEYNTFGKIRSSTCVFEDSVVFGSYDEFIYCLNVEDGSLQWKTNAFGSVRADLLWDANVKQLYVGTIKGMALAIEISNGGVIWKTKLDGPIFGSPCVMGCYTLWTIVTGKLYKITSDGSVIWTHQINGHIFSSLTSNADAAVFGCHDSYIYKITNSSEESCRVSSIVELQSEISSTPFMYHHEGRSFVVSVCNSGFLNVISMTSNKIVFSVKLPGESFSSPCVSDGNVYVGCRDDNLYCVNIEEVGL